MLEFRKQEECNDGDYVGALGLFSNVLDLPDSSALSLTQKDVFPKGYLIYNFPSIVKILNLVSIRVEVILELCNSLLRYSNI